MKSLSRWASRHPPLAIALLILCEVANGLNGLVLGSALLGNGSVGGLMVGISLVLGGAVYVRIRYDGRAGYWVSRRYLFAAFVSNYLLFGLVGGLMESRGQPLDMYTGARASRRLVVVAADTVAPAVDSVRVAGPAAVGKQVPSPSQTGRRLLYVFLGLLGLVLAQFSVGLACSLSCSGYGFGAALVFLFGFLGFLVSGIYFVKRALTKRLERTPQERQRDGRGFGLAWLILAGIFAALFLIAG